MLAVINPKTYKMNLEHYLKTQFIHDLQKLNYNHPNSVIQNNLNAFKIDEFTVFFGGRDWNNISNDIKSVQRDNYESFFLSIFTIVTIDLTFYTYFNDSYQNFRNNTRYPKFGWTGFGIHFENPRKLLDIPQKLGLFLENKINFQEYSKLFHESLSNYLLTFSSKITPEDFVEKIINDAEFNIDMNNNSISNKVINAIAKKY